MTALDYYHIMNHMETANDIGGLCKCLHVDRNGVPCRHAWYKRIPGRPAMCPRCLSRQWDSAKTPKAVTVTEKVETGENTNDF